MKKFLQKQIYKRFKFTTQLREVINSKNYFGSIQLCDSYLQQSPQNPLYYFYKGMTEQYFGHHDKAEILFLKSISLDEKLVESFVALGNLYYMNIDYGKAKSYFEKAIEIEPNNFKPYFGLALLYQNFQKNDDLSFEYFEKALMLKMKSPPKDLKESTKIIGIFCDFLLKSTNKNYSFLQKILNNEKEQIDFIDNHKQTIDDPEEKLFSNTHHYFTEDEFYFYGEGKKELNYLEKEETIGSFEYSKISVDLKAPESGILTTLDFKTNDLYEFYPKLSNEKKISFLPNIIKKVYGNFCQSEKNKNSIHEVIKEFKKDKRIVFLTGAGISKKSGLKTRKELWTELSRELFVCNWSSAKDEKLIWDLVKEFLQSVNLDPQPNASHHAISQLEKMGFNIQILTQNVDNLHQLAGSSNVIELHGTLSSTVCSHGVVQGPCKDYLDGAFPPKCEIHENCTLKPNVVLFGDMMNTKHMKQTHEIIKNCDLMVVVGCSMDVAPTCEFPVIAKRFGAKVIEIKRSPSRITPRAVDYYISDESEEVLPLLLTLMNNHTWEYSGHFISEKLKEKLKMIDHPNIIKYYGKSQEVYYTEYVNSDLIEMMKKPISFETKVDILYQIASSVDYLHSLEIPIDEFNNGNIHVASQNPLKVKLTFGNFYKTQKTEFKEMQKKNIRDFGKFIEYILNESEAIYNGSEIEKKNILNDITKKCEKQEIPFEQIVSILKKIHK